MFKDQMPNQVKKPFEEFKMFDILQSPNGNLFIKIAPLQAIAIGPYEGLGQEIPKDEVKRGSPIVSFDMESGKKWYIKVGEMKFKKDFVKHILENETA